jgi:uncharacterized protein
MLSRPGDRAVLGPSADGGYYLLGLKKPHRTLFDNIAWSTEHVARQTEQNAERAAIAFHRLSTWYDVDDVASLSMLRAELFESRSFSTVLKPYAAPHSRQLMASLTASAGLSDRLELELQ